MPEGPGKFDKELSTALESAGAVEGILIVMNSPKGGGFSSQLTPDNLFRTPTILRDIADQMERDMKEGIL